MTILVDVQVHAAVLGRRAAYRLQPLVQLPAAKGSRSGLKVGRVTTA